MVGVCASDKGLALHATLLLGCPAFSTPEEALEQAEMVLADSQEPILASLAARGFPNWPESRTLVSVGWKAHHYLANRANCCAVMPLGPLPGLAKAFDDKQIVGLNKLMPWPGEKLAWAMTGHAKAVSQAMEMFQAAGQQVTQLEAPEYGYCLIAHFMAATQPCKALERLAQWDLQYKLARPCSGPAGLAPWLEAGNGLSFCELSRQAKCETTQQSSQPAGLDQDALQEPADLVSQQSLVSLAAALADSLAGLDVPASLIQQFREFCDASH